MEVYCRLRDTPILPFINKLDRDIRDPIDLLDEVGTHPSISNARRSPGRLAWASSSKACIHLYTDRIHLYRTGMGHTIRNRIIEGLDNPMLDEAIGDLAQELREQLELVKGASHI